MAKKEITIISCDVCKQENAESLDKVMVIADGHHYEYGTNYYKEDKPISERLCFHQIDLCLECQERLLKEPIHLIHGFHQRGNYFFQKPKE